MRIDFDFVRVLLATIKEVQWDGGFHDLSFEDQSEYTMSLYIRLLDEAGLIDAVDYSTQDLVCWRAKWITAAGEEFLRVAENETCWEEAKSIVRQSNHEYTVKALAQALPHAHRKLRARNGG
ncbi:MAG TPA: DUF2513 domain-containing protein [Terriglobales bacterium]|jgi:hypothetical protein